ncbi:AraC family transcriptional regulator [Saccharospirillum salsuginis]|uniref:AraC family transcriptional regulator n=1 Tax=Saccharospirillum salsuginis TaxID=418750 RepID=A0A918K3T9_9GAMM|nr:AraC family transcriptional regulator [Saccharospirillum salsuginis]GGX42606.1 AraC family transcriptional regulator [Saccharospirillum salsuginis]
MAPDPTFYLKPCPALPYVEMRRARRSQACYHTHSHDEFSFGVIDQGQALYRNGSDRHTIGQGSTVTINPADAHSCNPDEGDWSYRMLFVDTGWIGRLQQELTGSGQDYQAFPAHFQSNPVYFQRFDTLFRQLEAGAGSLEAESLLVGYLAGCLAEGSAQRHYRTDSTGLARVRDRILDNLDQTLTLDELSQEAGVSRYHLIRTFKQTYGMAPHAYQLDHRIKRAKRLLRTGRPLSDVALDLGFADQAHFQRHFKQRLAMTPGQFQSFNATVV